MLRNVETMNYADIELQINDLGVKVYKIDISSSCSMKINGQKRTPSVHDPQGSSGYCWWGCFSTLSFPLLNQLFISFSSTSFVYPSSSLAPPLSHSFLPSLTPSLIPPLSYPFTHSSPFLPLHSFLPSLTPSLTPPLSHPFTHSSPLSPLHSLHSLHSPHLYLYPFTPPSTLTSSFIPPSPLAGS